MKLPYQCLCPLGKSRFFCAGKGASIHTFELGTDPRVISLWSHPFLKEQEAGDPQETAGENGKSSEQSNDQPPAKKRKLESKVNSAAEGGAGPSEAGTPEAATAGSNGQKKQKNKPAPPRPEVPFVILMTASEDGSHLVAVTGQDKAVWVFEHDDKGNLKELSQRAMPKRPSSISITADGKTILCADKFGDVYALPLIPPATPEAEAARASASPAPTAKRAAPKGANSLTVHSQRNLRALEDQLRQLGKQKQLPKEGPTFEHDLLLGHVSMLTAVTTAGAGGRPYIITGDRDEHIRVSRGIPQAHVIETYCLGSESFVTALCVPRSRPEILVSGGGDDGLSVWDWRAGRLLYKVDLLGEARKVVPDASKVAVSRLYSYDTDQGGCHVAAICERVPAVFVFQLAQDNTLAHAQTITLPGNPLDVAVGRQSHSDPDQQQQQQQGEPRLLTAVDISQNPTTTTTTTSEDNEVGKPPSSRTESGGEGDGVAAPEQSLLVFAAADGSKWVRQETKVQGPSTTITLDLSRGELDKLLYVVENLRKTEIEDAAADDGDQQQQPQQQQQEVPDAPTA